MTRNQIEYQKNLETQRANKAMEALRGSELEESRRHSLATEQEANRHNVVAEANDRFKATSVDAHYTRMDDATLKQIAETIAHNRVNELQGEAKIRFESNYGFSKLRNDIYTALLRSGGTWQSVLGIAGASLDQILNGGIYDPFAEVTGVGDTRSTNQGRDSHYTVTLRGNEVNDTARTPSSGSNYTPSSTRGGLGLSKAIQTGTSGVRDVMSHINNAITNQTKGSQMEVRQSIHLSPYETQKAIEKAQREGGRRNAQSSKSSKSQTRAVDSMWSRHS